MVLGLAGNKKGGSGASGRLCLEKRTMNTRQPVFFDNNIIDLLAALGVDPIEDLRDSEFEVHCTYDLREEYLQAASSSSAASHAARRLAQRMAAAYG